MDYAVIMAGGSGTRLWPLSRRGMPKQLLPLVEGRSLLQLAYERACALVEPSRILVCAGRTHREIISDQLPSIPEQNLLAEPQGRDSLAAITWSVATIARRDPDAIVVVLGADHIITPETALISTLREAMRAVSTQPDALVTCGVIPTSPHTGYGYLHIGEPVDGGGRVVSVQQFAEKPSVDKACTYLDEGGWWWNSGMFIFRGETFLDQVRILQPHLAQSIEAIVDHPESIDEIYPTLVRTSVDYAIMEPVSQGMGTARVLAVGLDAHWADIGGFSTLAQSMGAQGNATQGQVVSMYSSGNLIMNRSSDGHLIAVCGVDDMIVVSDDDVTLVCSMSQAESIKELRELAREQGERYA